VALPGGPNAVVPRHPPPPPPMSLPVGPSLASGALAHPLPPRPPNLHPSASTSSLAEASSGDERELNPSSRDPSFPRGGGDGSHRGGAADGSDVNVRIAARPYASLFVSCLSWRVGMGSLRS